MKMRLFLRSLLTAALCASCSMALMGCDKNSSGSAVSEQISYDGLSTEKPLRIDSQNHSFTILAQVNGKYFTQSTRHAIVSFDGSNSRKAVLMGLVPTKEFYDALLAIGAVASNNMNSDNAKTTHVTGDALSMTVKWQGADREYDINEIIKDSNGKAIDLHFGGNWPAAQSKKTGCLVCLDSCPVGIVSNSAYTYGAVESREEVAFYGVSSILPPDGTPVAVTFRVKK